MDVAVLRALKGGSSTCVGGVGAELLPPGLFMGGLRKCSAGPHYSWLYLTSVVTPHASQFASLERPERLRCVSTSVKLAATGAGHDALLLLGRCRAGSDG